MRRLLRFQAGSQFGRSSTGGIFKGSRGAAEGVGSGRPEGLAAGSHRRHCGFLHSERRQERVSTGLSSCMRTMSPVPTKVTPHLHHMHLKHWLAAVQALAALAD
jgi:hypothetical protein